MKVQFVINGYKGLEKIETIVEKDLYVGCGVKFLLHNTLFSVTGKVVEIDPVDRRLRVQSPQFSDWIGFDAIRDIIDKDTLYNDRLQAQIDHGIVE